MNLRMRTTFPRRLALAFALIAAGSTRSANALDKVLLAEGLDNPESAVVGTDGKIYVTLIGKSNVDGDGQVVIIEEGKARPFAKGLNDPKGIGHRGSEFFVADKNRVWRIDATGAANVYADTD